MALHIVRLVIAVAVALPLAATRGAAQVTAGGGAAVLLFPFVVADGERDTMVQLANRSTRVTYARCAYTQGEGDGTQVWFDLVLVARQSTHWVVSRGRSVDPTDALCTNGNSSTPRVTDCDGAGFDPGRIPPMPEGFRGTLDCVQLDRGGAPTSGNALRGIATLIGPAADITHAINDLGCRADDGSGGVQLRPSPKACTRLPPDNRVGFATGPAAQGQFCIPIARAWAFPDGDTVVAARVRDVLGNIGPTRERVIRIAPAQ